MTDSNIDIDKLNLNESFKEEKLNENDNDDDDDNNTISRNKSKKELKKLQKQQYKQQKKQDKKNNKVNKIINEGVPDISEEKINFEEPKTDREAYQVEVKHVREIYDRIALHFDSTRYKAWPIVEKFLEKVSIGSIGVDVGCGNGKYLGLNKNSHLIGSDICNNFTSICNEKHYESLVADNLYLPYKSNSFDYAISIAVIHHFSTFDRRTEALREIIRVLKSGATLLITSWATTQKWKGKNYDYQDVMVPWLFQNQFDMTKKNDEKQDKHISSNNKNNENENKNEDENENENGDEKIIEKSGSQYEVYHRYYHLFENGEFEKMVAQIPECEIIENNLDHDNYYCLIKKK
ncbi:hypothetical protein RB653_003903 [Dictyostelium firmibasis]|uniref:Methyltransferase type 11 domain-containing protein n=1 Tax=Dictyostelium firmibasis TaxID=79012 RepID=A0AAN7Z2X1_9MYCE